METGGEAAFRGARPQLVSGTPRILVRAEALWLGRGAGDMAGLAADPGGAAAGGRDREAHASQRALPMALPAPVRRLCLAVLDQNRWRLALALGRSGPAGLK